MSDKTRWRNARAEYALLGRCIAEPAAFDAVRDRVSARDFYEPPAAFAWEAMVAVRASDRAITEAALDDELRRRKRDKVCGLPDAFDAWRVASNHVRDAFDAAGIVARNAAARRTVDAAHDILDFAEREAENAEALAAHAIERITAASLATSDLSAVDLSEELGRFYDDIVTRAEHPGITGIVSGLGPLDEAVGGFDPGIYLLGALTAVGKTTLATNIMLHAASLNRGTVLYLSLEMMNAQLVRRIVAQRSGIATRAYRRANLTSDQLEHTSRVVSEIFNYPIRLFDRTDTTAMQIRSLVRREAFRAPLSLVIVDHIGLVTPSSSRREPTRQEQIAEIVWSLKILANEHRVPILALVQLNRESDRQQRRPRLSDLRDSGSLEHTAEAVIFLHRETRKNEGEKTVCIVAKNRNDETTEFDLRLEGATSRFVLDGDGIRHVPAATPDDVEEF